MVGMAGQDRRVPDRLGKHWRVRAGEAWAGAYCTVKAGIGGLGQGQARQGRNGPYRWGLDWNRRARQEGNGKAC